MTDGLNTVAMGKVVERRQRVHGNDLKINEEVVLITTANEDLRHPIYGYEVSPGSFAA